MSGVGQWLPICNRGTLRADAIMVPLPSGKEASSVVGAPVYACHRQERTLLCLLIREHYPAFKAHLTAQGTGLPGYVETGFEDLLKRNLLEHGLRRLPRRQTRRNPDGCGRMSCSRWWLPAIRGEYDQKLDRLLTTGYSASTVKTVLS